MTRILLLSPADANLAPDSAFSGITDPGTTIIHRRVAYAACPPMSAHDWALADLAVLAAGQHAGAEGFDAVCLADSGDYGANALRSVLDIPVVTAGRAAMLYAMTLGARFSILTTERDHIRLKKTVHEYGLGAQCAGVHRSEPGETAMPPPLCGDVAILAGVTRPCGAAIPLVDPVPLVVKLTESFVSLRLSHSRQAYPAPQVRKKALINAIG